MKYRNNIFRAITALTVVICIPFSALAQTQGSDFGGVWLPDSGSQWITDPPFTPAGQAASDGNIRAGGDVLAAFQNDPLAGANPPGLYRSFVYGRPWEFIQLPDRIIQIFEWTNHWRVIYMDGREVPEQVVTGPFWYGYSVGEWEGDTLVVQTVDLDGRAWLNGDGLPMSEYGAKVEERWTRVDPDTLEVTITVTDPEYYTRPWTGSQTFTLQPKGSRYGELEQVIFAPIDEVEFNRVIVDPSAEGPIPID